MDILVIVDMQNDFICGALGSSMAEDILPNVVEYAKNFKGKILFTKDCHSSDYLVTEEGRNLPVAHCVVETEGVKIHKDLREFVSEEPICKATFGSVLLGERIKQINEVEKIDSITFVGVCTDICVISNALLVKAFVPNVPLKVVASCCAGVTKESHENALKAMAMCHIQVV